jgi:hypothetical protein
MFSPAPQRTNAEIDGSLVDLAENLQRLVGPPVELFGDDFLGLGGIGNGYDNLEPAQCNIFIGGVFAGVGQTGGVDVDGKLNVYVEAPVNNAPIDLHNLCPVEGCRHVFDECIESMFDTKETLGVQCHVLNHIKNHKTLVCPWCNVRFTKSYHFDKHVMSTHHNGFKHYHHTCGKAFSSVKNFQGHRCFIGIRRS